MPEMVVIGRQSAMRRLILFLLPIVLAHALSAGETSEITVMPQPFTIRHEMTASAMPATHSPVRIDAKAWTEFEITRITPHATRVAKGDVLMAFDPEKIDEKIEDTRRATESRKQELAQAGHALKHLRETTPHKLDALRHAAEVAAEENAYFTTTRRKAEEEAAGQKLKRAKMFLENQREELRQLEKMYAADELVEETEEIILQRQRDRVEAAEFELRMEELNHQRQNEVLLPREAVKLAEGERDAASAYAKFNAEAPHAIAKAEHELESLRIIQERDIALLAKLEADRTGFEITAPADGWFYHGAIEDGRWTLGEAAKTLIDGGKPPVRRALATFIPADAVFEVIADLDGDTARRIPQDPQATAWLEGREEQAFNVKLKHLSATPDASGRHMAVFTAEWPDKATVFPSSKVHIRLISHHSPDAIVLPMEALRFDPEGWTVAVKLDDGKTGRRVVQRGRVFDGKCEITSGLETGQVVVPP